MMSWLVVRNTVNKGQSWFVRSQKLETFSKGAGVSLVVCECATVSDLLEDILETNLKENLDWYKIMNFIGEDGKDNG
ncbi:hypothetical protein LCGC14_0872450 [marine sediment metagenome]|uniref:Uncharacterized protein n=1 Tax=marine sediment metagenome TaxID=412755 RepID=A0A0F9SBA2_9ZZZZ